MSSLSDTVINLIENSIWDLEFEDISFKAIYDSASTKKMFNQLHSLYFDLHPEKSKLKPVAHWKNIRNSFEEDVKTLPELENKLSSLYANYYVHLGKKHLIIEQHQSDSLKNILLSHNFDSIINWVPEGKLLLINEDPEAKESPMSVVSQRKNANGVMSFLLYESIVSFYNEIPSEGLLSDEGRKHQSSMRFKKRVVVPGFHKIIISPDYKLRIFLIDSFLVGEDSALSKTLIANNTINKFLKSSSTLQEKKRVAFFPAIKRIYDDAEVGQVIGGCFYTSSGARYVPKSKGTGSDIRHDPFQKGGERASEESLSFTKIEVEFPEDTGKPTISLYGSPDMLERPDDSLHEMEVVFSTRSNNYAKFLKKPLEYGGWI